MGWFSKPREPDEKTVVYLIEPIEESRELQTVKETVAKEIDELKVKVSLLELLIGKKDGEDMASTVMRKSVGSSQ